MSFVEQVAGVMVGDVVVVAALYAAGFRVVRKDRRP